MNLIVAIAQNGGIGLGDKLLFSIPEDMRFFRQMTLKKVVVMGYNTLLSLPKSSPLPDRINIVLSRKPDLKIDNAIVCNSNAALFDALKAYNDDDIFVIGGESVYSSLMPNCNKLFVTEIQQSAIADKFFFVDKSAFSKVYESELKEHDGIYFKFCTYQKII